MKRILHLDMDAFFAAVEERRKPELRGKPVVIGGGGDPSSRGVVSTASYEARKYGIHSAMPLRTALRLCPQAIFLPVDYDEYVRYSALFKAVLRRFSAAMEDVGIDEAYLDLSENERHAEEIAREIKKQILDETGLTCSIGIAPNKLLAKIGSDMQKPDGLTILVEDDVSARIWPMPARKLLGVGPKTEGHLKEMGIDTIGQLAALPLERLTGEFGQSYGRYLYDASRGIDDSPIVTHWEPRSMSREMTFETDVRNWQVIAKTMAELTKDVVKAMRDDGYRGRTVTLKIRFSDFETHTRSISLKEPVDSEETIRRTVFECLKKVELKKRVRLIGVRMSNLEKKGRLTKKPTADSLQPTAKEEYKGKSVELLAVGCWLLPVGCWLLAVALSSGVLPDIALDVLPDLFLRLEDPEVAFAEDVGLQGQELLHGFAPAADVGLEARQERTVDVLAEKDSLSAPVQVEGHGTGSVSGRVEQVQLLRRRIEGFHGLP